MRSLPDPPRWAVARDELEIRPSLSRSVEKEDKRPALGSPPVPLGEIEQIGDRHSGVRPEQPRFVRLTSREDAARDVEGYRYLVVFHVNDNETHRFKVGKRNYAASLKGTVLSVDETHPKRNVGRIDLRPLIEGIQKDTNLTSSVSMNHEDMSFTNGNVKLSLINVNLKWEHGTYEIDHIYGYVMVK